MFCCDSDTPALRLLSRGRQVKDRSGRLSMHAVAKTVQRRAKVVGNLGAQGMPLVFRTRQCGRNRLGTPGWQRDAGSLFRARFFVYLSEE
jgi:hypothetical protein